MWQSFFLESAIQELALDKSQLLDTGLAKVLASTEKLTVLLSCFSGSQASTLRIDCFVSRAPVHFNTLMIYFPYFRDLTSRCFGIDIDFGGSVVSVIDVVCLITSWFDPDMFCPLLMSNCFLQSWIMASIFGSFIQLLCALSLPW